MTPLRVLWSRVTALFRRGRIDDELRRELIGHLDEATEEYVRQGLSATDARRKASQRLGSLAETERAYREHLTFRVWGRLRRDLRYALGGFRQRPAFPVAAIAVLAVGMAGVVTVFTLVDRIVLRSLPYAEADQLVTIAHDAPGADLVGAGISSGLLFHYRARSQAFESIGTYFTRAQILQRADAAPERVAVTFASVSLFQALRVAPAIGRLFTDEDATPGFMNVRWAIPVLLSHGLWVTRFGADPAVLGRLITIGNNPRRVVGVLPDGFAFPSGDTDVWMLMEPPEQTANFAQQFGYSALARMRPGMTADRARADLVRVLPSIAGAYADATPERIASLRLSPRVTPLQAVIVGDVANMLWPVFGGMLLLLLIACANAGGLFLVRAERRRQEVAVRQALGADHRDVARLFFIEALVLTIAATGIALALAAGAVAMTLAWAPVELPRMSEIRLDRAGVTLAIVLAVGVAAVYAIAPLRYSRRPTAADLLASGRSLTGDRRRTWTGQGLLVLQVAFALSLVVGSALMALTYRNLSRRDLGFSPERLLTLDLALSGRMAGDHPRLYGELLDRIRKLPMVTSAAAGSFAPLTTSEHVFPVVAGAAPIPFKFVTPGYFQTMQTPVVRGTELEPGTIPPVDSPVLISAALARRLFPAGNAIGQPVRRLNEDGSVVTTGRDATEVPPFTVAGVVGDVHETSLREAPSEIVYVPMLEPLVERSIMPINVTIFVRTDVDATVVIPSIREIVGTVSRDLTVTRVRTMENIVQQARGRETFVGGLLVIAATASLFLGIVGVYGSVSQAVRQRTRELGIRIALGATRGELVRLVTATSMWAVAAGILIGLVVAASSADLLGALLFGVAPREPIVFGLATAILTAAAGVAAFLASRRATHIQPVSAMQRE